MKKVLITGGNKGIGLSITELFYENGFDTYVVGRDFSSFINVRNKNLHAIKFDISNIEKLSDLKDKVGDIDILINNAGIMNSLPYDKYPEDKKKLIVKTNLEAPIELIRLFSKSMVKNKNGRIVSVASIAGQIGHPDIWYGITKAGVINFTKSFAKILGPNGVVVNCVAPGPVDTNMLSTIPEERKESLKKSSILGRFAKPEEVAKAIYWLTTDCPEHINGICIDINNGSFMR